MNTMARLYTFSGRVQGVGFRNITASLAQRYPVKGYVRNLNDGRVELHVEANVASMEAFLAAIQEHFRQNIRVVEVVEVSPKGYATFSIQHAG